MKEPTPSDRYWMRPISFAGLLRVLQLVASHSGELTPLRLNSLIGELGAYLTKRGTKPSVTTLYHCRNTLLRLGAVRKEAGLLVANLDSRPVRDLLLEPATGQGELSDSAREAFAELVIGNEDCRSCFFDYFMSGHGAYDVEAFRRRGTPATWTRECTETGQPGVLLQSNQGRAKECLSREAEIQSVLYGVRYWARDELGLIDEFGQDDGSATMFPICRASAASRLKMLCAIAGRAIEGEWITLSVRQLIGDLCLADHYPIASLFDALDVLTRLYADRVVTIPTSRDQATQSARSRLRENLELRGYYRDYQGRFVSHIRIHRSIEEVLECRS